MRRAAISLCVVLRDEIGRIDLDVRDEPRLVQRRKRSIGTESRDALRTLFAAAPLGSEVVWIDESIWTQTITLPRVQVGGVDRAALTQAIGFEIEPLMGLAVDRAEIAFLRADSTEEDERNALFWVSAIAKRDLEVIAALSAEHSSRLSAWCHPAGLALAESSAGAHRVEVFDLATMLREAGRFPTLVAARPGQGSWRALLGDFSERVRSSRSEIELLDPIGAVATEFPDLRTQLVTSVLADDEAARDFALQARAALRHGSVPIGRRERPRRVVLTPLRVALSALLVLVAWIAYDIAALDREALAIESEAATAEKIRTDADRLRKSKQDAERKVQELRAEVEHTRNVLTFVDRAVTPQRSRISQLLAALADQCPAGVMLESIRSDDSGDLEILGIAATRALVDRLAMALKDPLAPLEMDVEPPETESTALSNGRVITRFHLRIVLRSAIPFDIDLGSGVTKPESKILRTPTRGRG